MQLLATVAAPFMERWQWRCRLQQPREAIGPHTTNDLLLRQTQTIADRRPCARRDVGLFQVSSSSRVPRGPTLGDHVWVRHRISEP
eukprot:SM000043S15853  [mRNA]  locus=s43:500940:501321:+ [translate_table: standard]